MNLDRLFDPKVSDDHPRLERIFEMAKQDFWNESTVVDWKRDFVMPAEHRRPLARILSIIYYGERAALEVSAQLIGLVEANPPAPVAEVVAAFFAGRGMVGNFVSRQARRFHDRLGADIEFFGDRLTRQVERMLRVVRVVEGRIFLNR